MIDRAEGKIFTFYSYKGGTGRTMALANVAWILASNAKRVLAVDWDLEAPGLHRYFGPFLSDPRWEETDGLIEFFSEYMVAATKAPPGGHEMDEDWYRSYADIRRYAEPVQWRFPEGGSIDIVGAGRQVGSYGMRVNSFDWQGFYVDFGGGAFLDETIRQMKETYDYVLIDSRTGISDTSGICTVHMPDSIVIFYTLNNQSIEGASGVASNVLDQRLPDGISTPSDDTFRVLTVASRVELAEKEKLEARRALARDRFAAFLDTLPELTPDQRERYWGEMEILYDPYYAYEEVLATIADSPNRPNTVLAALERLTGYLTAGEVEKLGRISENKRLEALQTYYEQETGDVRPGSQARRAQQAWDIIISASQTDQDAADRLYYLLESNYRVFYAPHTILPGDAWQDRMVDAIGRARMMVVLFSEKSAFQESEMQRAEISTALERVQRGDAFSIVPVQLDPDARPGGKIGKELARYQWLTAWDGDIQNIAATLRRTLDPVTEERSDVQQVERLRLELEQALKERSALTEQTNRLREEITSLAREKGSLEERVKQASERTQKAVTKSRQLTWLAVIAILLLAGVFGLLLFTALT